MKSRKRRILFVAEAVSLAHVTRPLTLAKSLPADEWEVHFACGDGYRFFLTDSAFRLYNLHSISSRDFLRRLALGLPSHTAEDLNRYVDEDRDLLERIKPDVVVGDMRVSLSISARQWQVPYVALTNAYWSPYFTRWPFPVRENPDSKIFGASLPIKALQTVEERVLGLHMRPMNQVRERYGLPPISDLRQLYADADWVIYLDAPTLVRTHELPPHHVYIGPLLWSPENLFPHWWNDIPTDRPSIYLSLGSSGKVALLPDILQALATLDATILLATAGRLEINDLPSNVLHANYLPGVLAAARSVAVVSNGGSGSAYQALSHGRPLLGICSNMDQYLTMDCVEAAGAGLHLLASHAGGPVVRTALEIILSTPAYAAAAKKFERDFLELNPAEIFLRTIDRAVASSSVARSREIVR